MAEIALRDGADDARDLGGRLNEITDHRVDGIDALDPSACRCGKLASLADATVLTDGARNAVELPGKALVQLDDVVEGFRDLTVDPGQVEWQAGRKVAPAEGPETLE